LLYLLLLFCSSELNLQLSVMDYSCWKVPDKSFAIARRC